MNDLKSSIYFTPSYPCVNACPVIALTHFSIWMLQINLLGNKEQHLSLVQHSYSKSFFPSYVKHTSVYEPADDPFTTSVCPYGNKKQVWQEVRSRLSERRILKCTDKTCQGSIHHRSCAHWRNIHRMSETFIKVACWLHDKRIYWSQQDCFKHSTLKSNCFSVLKPHQGT